MRFSAHGLAGLHPELEALLRRADPQAGPFLEALRITGSDIRQRKDQWNAADSLTGLQVLDHGVRLAETVQTLIPERAPHTSYFTDLELDGRFPFTCPVVEWAGADPADIEFKRVKAWLHPRRNPANPQTVVKWRLDLLRIVKVGGLLGFPAKRQLFCAPIADPVYAPVVGSAEGLVTFDYSIAPVLARPRPKQYGLPNLLDVVAAIFNAVPAPVTLLIFTGLDKDGAPATNIGLGYDNTVASVTTNGNVLSSRELVAPAPPVGALLLPVFQPGTHGDDGAGGGTPRLIIEYGTYTNDDLTFSGAGNRLDLGSVPTNPVVFTINGAVPTGTQLTGQVLKDGGTPATDADWRTFLSGQSDEDLADVGKRQTYEIRAKLLTDATGSLTPELRTLGAEELTTKPAYDAAGHSVARLQLSGGYGIDLLTLQGEVVEGMVVGILDGERDYHSWIENLLADADLTDYTFRLWVGAARLSKDKWLHIDDYLPRGQHPRASDYAIPVVSVLTLIRGLLPKKSPGAAYAVDGDITVGGYTTDTGGGANLYQQIDEADADDLDYIQSAVDPVNAIYKASLPTPADLPGRRLYVDYRIQKDIAAGKTIDATIELRQAGTLIATSGLQANISDLITPGSFQLSDASVTAITDPANLELWVTFNVGGAGGSRRGRLTWWRFRTEDRRQAVTYVNQSVKAVYDDLLANQLEVDVRYRGPGLEDTTTLIGKAISEVDDDEQPTGKDELEAVAHVVGYGLLGSQGTLKAVNMKDAGEFRFVWPMEEIRILSITQGIEDRIDNYVVPFNLNAAADRFDDEWQGASAAGVLAYGKAKNSPLERLPQEIAEWIQPQAIADYAVHARAVGTRVLDWFATGRGRALIETDYMFPELEPGDSGVFETDQLIVRDPHTGEVRRGRMWLSAKIELCDDPDPCSGRRFTVAIRPLHDLFGPGSAAVRMVAENLLILGYSRARPTTIGEDWNLASGSYARPAVSTGADQDGNIQISSVELPQGARLSELAIHCYLDNQSAGSGQIVTTLWKAPLDGTTPSAMVSISQATGGGGVVNGTWQTFVKTISHTVDWTTNNYFTETALRALGTIDNMRFMWNRIRWD
jgi:hypothetical protein